jgi:hypothetical protein
VARIIRSAIPNRESLSTEDKHLPKRDVVGTYRHDGTVHCADVVSAKHLIHSIVRFMGWLSQDFGIQHHRIFGKHRFFP